MRRLIQFTSFAALLVTSAATFAAAFSVVPTLSFPSTIKLNETATASYTITNVAPDSRTMTVRNIVLPQGVTIDASASTCAAAPFSLIKSKSCSIALKYTAATVGTHVQHGPQVCNDDFNCNIPGPGQEINMQVVAGNAVGDLGVKIAPEQHLQARALTITNDSTTKAITMPTDFVTVSSNLENKIVVCKADGSNCDRTSTCQGQTLAPGASCKIWLAAKSAVNPNENPAEDATKQFGVIDGSVTVADNTTFDVQYGLDLYAATDSAAQLSRFDGNTWHDISLTPGLNTAWSLATSNDDLYIGGRSDMSTNGSNFIKWNGSSSSQVNDNELSQQNDIHALYTYNNKIYAQTSFGKNTDTTIGVYDGTKWTQLGNTVEVNKHLLVTSLIRDASGDFYAAIGSLNNGGKGVYRLDNTTGQWHALGTNFETIMVSDIASFNGKLYAVNISPSSTKNVCIYVYDKKNNLWNKMNIEISGQSIDHFTAQAGKFAQMGGSLYVALNQETNENNGSYAAFKLDSTMSTWNPITPNLANVGAGFTALYSYNGNLFSAGNFEAVVAYLDLDKDQWTGINMPKTVGVKSLFAAPRIASISEATDK